MSALDVGRPARGALYFVLVLTLAMLGARWATLDRLLPALVEPDSFHVLEMQSLRGDPALRQHQMFSERYPDLLPRVLAPLPHGPATSRSELRGTATLDDERAHLAAAGAPYRTVRTAGLLLSLLAIPATWLAARAFLAERFALLAAWFSATSLLAFTFSTQARPHAPQAAFAILSVALSLRVVRGATLGRVLGAALAAALALALLQNGAFTLPPLALALLLAPGSARARWLRAMLVPVAVAITAFQFYPFAPRIDASGIHLAGKGGHEFSAAFLDGTGFAKTLGWLFEYDPLLTVLAGVGLVVALARRAYDRRTSAAPALTRGAWSSIVIAGAYVVPYLIVIGINGENYERFTLPLVPWVAILAASGIAAALEFARLAAWARVMTWSLVGLIIVVPIFVDARFVAVARAPDTLEQTAQWLRANVVEPRARILASPGLSLPIFHEAEALDAAALDPAGAATAWIMYQKGYGLRPEAPLALSIRYVSARAARAQPETADALDLAEISAAEPEFFVVERSAKTASLPGLAAFARRVEAQSERVFVSEGDDAAALGAVRIDYQGAHHFLNRLLAMRAFGPRIEIWERKR